MTKVGKTSKPEKVELSNISKQAQDAILIQGVAVNGPFVVNASRSNCRVGVSLPARGKCQFALSYAPTASTDQSGTLTINDNTAAEQAVVVLKGKGRK